MKISYQPTGINNFHNSSPINLIVSNPYMSGVAGCEVYEISKSQARKIENHFCGIKECRCPGGAVVAADFDRDGNVSKFEIRKEWCNNE